ncbi:hypothetical protein BCR32DRAFT_297967 [Anaeromyces robustus]|uniref:Uncharacterized protein n=1 Tax=Anaeromyces robustus TaxID=1754192 RepID=A0A1Y1VVE1_9FUNG|nr:hypothetical protein BCR32DRAFT_297967 [Anaeromyces robustus]|eukprot:ORX64734.1 hypothetical protein BCR32DRAFT_297967 [Anaeromyces robustus]
MEVSFGAGSRPGAGSRTRGNSKGCISSFEVSILGISCNHRDIQKAFPHGIYSTQHSITVGETSGAYSEARGIRRRYRSVRANLNVPAVNMTAAEQWYPLRNSLHTYMVMHRCVGHMMEMGPINIHS